MPPSLEILLQRLQGRGTESGTVIEKRMMNARKEIAQSRFYQYIVVNDDLEDAKQELFSIIQRHTTG
jgi:guanylate kinase